MPCFAMSNMLVVHRMPTRLLRDLQLCFNCNIYSYPVDMATKYMNWNDLVNSIVGGQFVTDLA